METNYENIPISDDVKKGMSLTPYDQLFIKRLFDRQDMIMGEVIDAMTKVIAEKFNEQTAILFEIQKDIVKIKKVVANHEIRLTALEKRFDDAFKGIGNSQKQSKVS